MPTPVGLATRPACETSGMLETSPSDSVVDTKDPPNLNREVEVAEIKGGVVHDGDNEVV